MQHNPRKMTKIKLTEWQKMAIAVAVERTTMEPRSKAELLKLLDNALEIHATLVKD